MSNEATHEQVQVISDLIADVFKSDIEMQRVYTGSVVTAKYGGKLSHDRAQEMISNLKRRKTTSETVDLRGLAGGRYAVRDEKDNRVRFFKVSTSKRTGTIFVDEQAGSEFYLVGKQFPSVRALPYYVGRYADLLKWAVANEQESFELYGQELGYCGVCGRELTAEESRAIGIGPVCIKKMGYEL